MQVLSVMNSVLVPPVTLSINDYFVYMDSDKNSRRIYEGGEVFNAGHLILCGRLPSKTNIEIYALCLQTSSLQSSPHIITGELKIIIGHPTVVNMSCSCKGGNSGRCKHISAVLIYCTRCMK